MGYPTTPTFTYANPENTFLTTNSKSYSYSDLYHFSNKLSEHYPEKLPILVVADNTPEVIFLLSACFLLDIPVIPVHPESRQYEIDNILEHISPGAVYVPTSYINSFKPELPELQLPAEWMSADATIKPFAQESHPDSVAAYMHTSGSTSSPKIVPVKKRQVFFAAKSSERNLKPSPNKYWLLCLPLNHVGGLNVIYRSLFYHSAIYLIPSFDVEKIRRLLHENKSFEAASMVPTMLERLLEESFFRVQFGFKGLLLGGGPISLDLINRSLTRGVPIVTSYGMTETCAQIASNPMLRSGGMYIPKKSVGAIFRPNEVEIRDDNQNKLPYLESGHIWLKGPQIFDGYLRDELNQTSFDQNGWFNTGDYGHINRKGHLFIESRRTDLILSGGENISPNEVEEALLLYPGIKEAAVAGIPDKIWGQKVVAFILFANENTPVPDDDAIRLFLLDKLHRFKIPKDFVILQHLPKTATGKIKRSELRKIYHSNK